MELNREHFGAIIFNKFLRGLTQQQCIDELNSIFRSSLQDIFREGLPKSGVVQETIDAVRQLILQDRHVAYHENETTLGISGTSICSILHESLTVKKIVRVGSTQFVNRFQKVSYRLAERNAPNT